MSYHFDVCSNTLHFLSITSAVIIKEEMRKGTEIWYTAKNNTTLKFGQNMLAKPRKNNVRIVYTFL